MSKVGWGDFVSGKKGVVDKLMWLVSFRNLRCHKKKKKKQKN